VALALLAFVPPWSVREGLEQPNPCRVVAPADGQASQRAILNVPAPGFIPALGETGRSSSGQKEGTGHVQVFASERFGPFGRPAGWVCARWRARTTDFPRIEACPAGPGRFVLLS